MKKFEPGLGQMAFGQPSQQLKCPEHVEDALEAIRWTFLVLYGPCADPFANTGGKFECSAFRVHAYDWDPDAVQEFNFAWRDVRVSWYKWLGRGTSIDRVVTRDEAKQMLRECLGALLEEGRGFNGRVQG